MAEQQTPSSPPVHNEERVEESQGPKDTTKVPSSKADADRMAMPPPTSTVPRLSPEKKSSRTTESVQRASPPEEEESSDREDDEDDEDSSNSVDSQVTQIDPREAIEPFNWDEFRQNHSDRMHDLGENEKEILERFQALTQLFHSWAEAGSYREADRAQKRLNTRVAHVQNSEGDLEQKREKYSRVMAAFQSALQLLETGE